MEYSRNKPQINIYKTLFHIILFHERTAVVPSLGNCDFR